MTEPNQSSHFILYDLVQYMVPMYRLPVHFSFDNIRSFMCMQGTSFFLSVSRLDGNQKSPDQCIHISKSKIVGQTLLF